MRHDDRMGLFGKRQPSLATVRRRAFRCLVCGGHAFWTRDIKMNTTGMEFLDLGWANASALGLICAECGYLHEFAGQSVELWKVDGGYPPGAE
jgi:hypothetical protein